MLVFWVELSVLLASVSYQLFTALQEQLALQASVEKNLEAANERAVGERGLLETQLNRLEEEVSGHPLEDVDLRLLRAQNALTRYEATWGLLEVKQVLRLRIRILAALQQGQK